MVLIAKTTTGCTLAFKVDVPPSAEDLRRLAAIQSEPGLAGATWTGKGGGEVR